MFDLRGGFESDNDFLGFEWEIPEELGLWVLRPFALN